MLEPVLKFFSPMAINVQTVSLTRENILRPIVLYEKQLHDLVKCFRPLSGHVGAKIVF